MKLSRRELEGTICLACAKKFGEHTKASAGRGGIDSKKFHLPTLMECMFRIQGSFMELADEKQAKQSEATDA